MANPNPQLDSQLHTKPLTNGNNILKFVVFSAIGIFMFFIPISINGTSSIMLDHIVTYIQKSVPGVIPYYALLVILLGAIYPFYTKTWNKDGISVFFSVFKIIGLVVACLLVFKLEPKWLADPDMGPFLFNKLVISVGLLVPIGSVFLALLVGYGLLEFIGVLMQPVMRPVWKTPGRSAVDAVASFVGSYSIGLLITNRVFKEGKYTVKEAAIIATGFSTVSATFMIVVAKTLDLMDMWNLYFWGTLVITFIVTALTVRIWPLRSMSDEYFDGEGKPEELVKGDRFKHAWKEAMEAAQNSPSLGKNIWMNLKDGFIMTMSILPSILSVGLLGLVLAEFTPVFDIIGYIFYPITALFHLPDPLLAAKASALSIAEMFLPALLVTGSAIVTKFVIAVVSVSAIIFFSALIPCIVSTDIPISLPKLLIIWLERVILTLIITIPIAFLFL
ncbi:YjiH family protein [Heyndrickxia sporothermodurans]|uniref:YjiH family protein n=1 Tax=Heyndrickxia sporothermodurans TaxID=46224 RepID=UPI000D33CC54|nr:YjiH family protein [Heyndrickxia sporothermodurans]MED3650741.1 YjiH family protein [Heyndrickxia sporothermodurans]MED3698351.1 YjiH family protein [Heyndrickxia sporothermodurans]PTY78909.1 histidine transporter [Heyndrickxia sporothermodurans]